MLTKYIQAAMHKAKYEILPDDKTYYGEIPGFQGVWANAPTLAECREELEKVLEAWIHFRETRDLPLPAVDRIFEGRGLSKADLIEKVAADAKLSKAQATRAIDSFLDGVTSSLRSGSKVSLAGFGTFSVAQRKARTARSQRSSRRIAVQARRVPRFKAGKKLIKAVK